MVFLLMAAGTWFAAALGASMVAFVKKEKGRFSRLVFGFAAGVILMVSFVELLHPAIHQAELYSSLPAWVIVPGSFTLGFVSVFLLDKFISRFKAKKSGGSFKYRRSLMLSCALAAHNLPEGFALGILLGAVGEPMAVIPVAVAIGAHKLPEGTAIAVSFQKDGMTKFRSFLLGQVSGFIGFLSGIAGFALAVNINAVLPYAMAFAGGAMVWVAIHELIPEAVGSEAAPPIGTKKSYLATVGIILGILLMLFIDTTLHEHKHGHRHHHECTYECEHH